MSAVKWNSIIGKTKILAHDPTTDYTVKQIIRVATESAQHKEIIETACALSNSRDPTRAVFDYVYENVVYTPDENDYQDIKYAHKTLQDRSGNCVDYSVLISALLQNLGVPHKLRVASYEVRNEFEHIYPVTNSGVIMDCVLGQLQDGTETFSNRPPYGSFNKQQPFLNKKDFQVPTVLRTLGRIGAGRNYRGRNYRKLGILLYCGRVGPVDHNRKCKIKCVEKYPNCDDASQSHLQKYCKDWCGGQDNNDILPTATDFSFFESNYYGDYQPEGYEDDTTNECPPGYIRVGGNCVQNPFGGNNDNNNPPPGGGPPPPTDTPPFDFQKYLPIMLIGGAAIFLLKK